MRHVLLSCCLLVLLCGTVAGQTPEEVFARANEAYERGAFADAVAGYQSLLQYRVRDPRLEYNLANAEFKLGRLGRAILHYERARRMDPTDPDILANLAYARAQTRDRVPPQPVPSGVRALLRLQDYLGPDLQAWIALAWFWALALLAAWGLSGPGRWSAWLGWLAAVLVLALGVTVASWFVTYRRLEGKQLAVVLQQQVEVLAGPGYNNATLFTIHEGLTVELRGASREEWLQVSLPNGLNGWVPLEAVEPV